MASAYYQFPSEQTADSMMKDITKSVTNDDIKLMQEFSK
jgi:hypothetical protein